MSHACTFPSTYWYYSMQPGSLLPIVQYVPLPRNHHSNAAPTEQASDAADVSFDEQDTFGIHDVIDFASFVQTFGDCRYCVVAFNI